MCIILIDFTSMSLKFTHKLNNKTWLTTLCVFELWSTIRRKCSFDSNGVQAVEAGLDEFSGLSLSRTSSSRWPVSLSDVDRSSKSLHLSCSSCWKIKVSSSASDTGERLGEFVPVVFETVGELS